ncbi:hypothetical protein [Colwellia sp. BRX9-1]|uniref:hypothetical protein n=1 Tax=Colwellia sp. BRX9-1 TaxID=2759830 RepID=UPI0015F50E86|nr:hypothetical protein [Colwellia sp. BRX9-1]MBA6350494.1 hypothetical protein [Colwellia sp. BRX9-1]
MKTDIEIVTKEVPPTLSDVPIFDSVNIFFSENALWLVPILLVLIQFFFKLFVAERASFHQVWKNFLQSPVDVGFLALSFSATLLITTPKSSGGLFGTALVFILLLVISIVIWKSSPTHTTKKSVFTSSVFVLFNFIITGSMLVYSISMMLRI